jgi:fluoroacetyl-CoA thioesterase
MKASLVPGIRHQKRYVIPEDKTVPHVYPESPMFLEMPKVFATAYLVGLVEWACMEAIAPHLDPAERSVGTEVRLTHSAASLPGMAATVSISLEGVDGRRLSFKVSAHDGVDPICEGTHERFVIDPERFLKRLEQKAQAARAQGSGG